MMKILCVEDEPDLREDLVEVLEEEGYEVAVASNGDEGLREFVRFKPDLILSDCLMPVMDGIKMLEAIRTGGAKAATTPIVFISANAQKSHIEAGLDTGAQHYLTKPVDYNELIRVIRRILDERDNRQEPDARSDEKSTVGDIT